MKNTTDNIQNTNRGSNGGQTTISGASNPHKLRVSAQTMKLSPMNGEYIFVNFVELLTNTGITVFL